MKNIIQYILDNTKLKQKDIAAKLNVSTTQISKWKNGEYISFDKKEELEKLAGIVEYNIEWTKVVKTQENSNLWVEYLEKITEYCDYDVDVDKEITINLLQSIVEFGIYLPSKPPKEDIESKIDDDSISKYFYLLKYAIENYSQISYWCDIFIKDYEKDDLLETMLEIHDYAFLLAIINIDENYLQKFKYNKTKFNTTKEQTKRELKQSIDAYCKEILKAGLPIITDYFDMLKRDPQWLEDEAMLHSNNYCVDKYFDYNSRRIYDSLHIINENLLTLLKMIDSKTKEN